MEKYTCCLCGKEFEGFGNNPYPLSEEGRCCNICNNEVICARLRAISPQQLVEDEDFTENLRQRLDNAEESEILSVLVMILQFYTEKYNKSLNDTITLVRKGYKKFLELLEEA